MRKGNWILTAAVLLLVTLSSCFTGIESTKRVELGKEDRRKVLPTPEDTFLNVIKSTPIGKLKGGERFLATDDRLALILEQNGFSGSNATHSDYEQGFIRITTGGNLKGHTLTFCRLEEKRIPDGNMQTSVVLRDGNTEYTYPTRMSADEAPDAFTTDKLPMLIDLQMVADASALLSGRNVWTRTQLWYSGDSIRMKGRKFIPVKISHVEPGSTAFPLKVFFTDNLGNDAFVYMNFGSSGNDSRSFGNLFSLSDVRQQYNSIPDDIWENICNGVAAAGMTKDQVRLALGAPIDVNSGHTHSESLDLWKYPDGRVLHFTDGILVGFIH